MHPADDLELHFRLIPAQKAALRRLGIRTIGNLLRHFPSRHESLGSSGEARHLAPGSKVTLFGTFSKLKAKKLWKSRRNATEGWFEDATGKVRVMWFNQPYMASYVREGNFVKMSGTVGGSAERPYIANPEVEEVPLSEAGLFKTGKNEAAVEEQGLFPVYPESRGVTSKWFFHALKRVFEQRVHENLEDPVPADIRERYHLPDIARALLWMHVPEKLPQVEVARKRFAFEEIFSLQIARAQERRENDSLSSFPIHDGALYANRFLDSLPFAATRAQKRAVADILGDFEKPHPMARLLEGDVGSGKTAVAAAVSYAVVHARPPGRNSGTLQVAYMAPTEILAGQHFESFIEYFKDLPVNIALITGSGCKKFPSKVTRGKATDISRSQLLKWVAGGEIAMIVGTHALIQKALKFQHLALCIVDEQHRFGTAQRRALAKKGDAAPHFLSMTATPIPRTLALTLYGDLDLSILDELPAGRVKVETEIVKSESRRGAYETIRTALAAGRQAYVICPRIEEPDPANWNALQAKSVKAEAKRLAAEVFPEYRIGILHGAMKTDEKDEVMEEFARGDIHVLVATSVVEVGINVPNATHMIIEGAERFGLSQLHQLRGRIQRSSHPPRCFLFPETAGAIALKRLRALVKSSDGFELAEADLEARGAGDLYGKKQWGMSDLGMEALQNVKLIRAAREEAAALVAKDPTLAGYPALQARVAETRADHHGE